MDLREEMSEWGEWLANEVPPWAAYQAFLLRRLCALNKEPGTQLVGIRNAFLRYVGKLLLKETGLDGKEACGARQMCMGLEAGIEGVLHSIVEVARRNDAFHYASGSA